MDFLTAMSPAQAAALNVGLLILVMLGLKMYVGGQRAKLRLPSGATNDAFSRVQRVQMNAVEDVPPLMAGLVALAALGMPAWYIHLAGLVLVVSRVLHAVGLARSSGVTFGRFAGTLGTMAVYLAVAGALLVHAFTPAG